MRAFGGFAATSRAFQSTRDRFADSLDRRADFFCAVPTAVFAFRGLVDASFVLIVIAFGADGRLTCPWPDDAPSRSFCSTASLNVQLMCPTDTKRREFSVVISRRPHRPLGPRPGGVGQSCSRHRALGHISRVRYAILGRSARAPSSAHTRRAPAAAAVLTHQENNQYCRHGLTSRR